MTEESYDLSVEKSENKCLTFLRTFEHLAYLVLNVFVLGYGLYISFTIPERYLVDKPENIPIKNLKEFTVLYGTIWNYVFQTMFLFLSLFHDGLEWTNKHHSELAKKISYWRDVIFSGLVIPYTCFVFGMFWSLYAIDRELVFPKVYDDVVPWWFNQCVHTNILVLVIIETLLQRRRHPRDEKLELTMNAICGILYAIVYYSIYFFANRWLYNVFGLMNWWQVCIFQCCIWGSNYIFYIIQFPLNRLVHKEEQNELKEDNTTEKEVEKREGSLKYRNVKENSSL